MKKIGIIGAMEVEVEALKKDMQISSVIRKAQMEFCAGTLNGMEAVVVRSGVCKVNAAVCTQILVDDFGVDAIINTGVAGSLNADINIGDIVISTDVVHHDVNAVTFGYAPGQFPVTEDIAARFKEQYGLEPNRKTIYTAISDLQALGFDIHFDKTRARSGYYLGKRPLTEAELYLLIDGIESLDNLK